jgi:hypothetical protein
MSFKKAIASLIAIFAVSLTFGQNAELSSNSKFQYSEFGLNDYVIINVPSKTKEEIFSETINWIKETYKNPDVVLKMQIENEKVRIDAIAKDLLKVRNLASNLNYVVEISFKENKYKFELLSLLYENSTDYKRIPNFKTDKKLIRNFGNTPTDIENYLNGLNESLKNYILGNLKEDNW